MATTAELFRLRDLACGVARLRELAAPAAADMIYASGIGARALRDGRDEQREGDVSELIPGAPAKFAGVPTLKPFDPANPRYCIGYANQRRQHRSGAKLLLACLGMLAGGTAVYVALFRLIWGHWPW